MDRPSVDLALRLNYTAFCHSHLTSHRLTLSRVWLSFIMARASPSTNLPSISWTLSRLGSPSYTAILVQRWTFKSCGSPFTSQGWTFGRFISTSYTAWTFRHGHLTSHRSTHCRMWLSFIVTRASVTQLDPCKVQLSFLHVRGISPWPYPITNKTSSTFCPVCKHYSYSPPFVLCVTLLTCKHH